MIKKLFYWQRIFITYLFRGKNNLSFWHGEPYINNSSNYNELDEYYMEFFLKAKYDGDYDSDGIPQLNYKGDIGIQYNPIAIAQWSLGNYNLWKQKNNKEYFEKFIKGSKWLNENLNLNEKNVYVWNHNFNWTYKEELVSPWYSGLAQGQGLSVLCRAYKVTKDDKYLDSIKKVYSSLNIDIKNGGVNFSDKNGDIWIEEYIMKNEPTHILNGFIWGLWGIYDYWLLTKDNKSKKLFDKFVQTLENNLDNYDIGHWSLYELSNLKIKMRASLFYHKLHITQLKVLYKMTGKNNFKEKSLKWNQYLENKIYVLRAFIMKVIFKLTYY